MVEFIDDGQCIRVWSKNSYIGEIRPLTDYECKTTWLFDGSFGAIDAEKLKQIAEYMMTLNESEAA